MIIESKHDPICDEWTDGSLCICRYVDDARADEREQAAQRIIKQVGGTDSDGNVRMVQIPKQGWHHIDVAEACIAAVRGDGEQA
jgi:hypothetical protein